MVSLVFYSITCKIQVINEGVDSQKIFVTGNTVVDAIFFMKKKIKKIGFSPSLPAGLFDGQNKLVLVTAHRRENFGRGLHQICNAILKLSKRHLRTDFLFPVHLNPNVRKSVYEMIGNEANIHLIDPLDYMSFVYVMDKSYLILTDSGGIQEEAPSLGKPVLVMRNVSERPEGIEAGVAKLIGTREEDIIDSVSNLLENESEYQKMSRQINLYGDEYASKNIIEIINRKLL